VAFETRFLENIDDGAEVANRRRRRFRVARSSHMNSMGPRSATGTAPWIAAGQRRAVGYASSREMVVAGRVDDQPDHGRTINAVRERTA